MQECARDKVNWRMWYNVDEILSQEVVEGCGFDEAISSYVLGFTNLWETTNNRKIYIHVHYEQHLENGCEWMWPFFIYCQCYLSNKSMKMCIYILPVSLHVIQSKWWGGGVAWKYFPFVLHAKRSNRGKGKIRIFYPQRLAHLFGISLCSHRKQQMYENEKIYIYTHALTLLNHTTAQLFRHQMQLRCIGLNNVQDYIIVPL